MKNYIRTFIILFLLGVVVVGEMSCKARDCRGRRKTVKTAMGGWL